MWSCGEPALQTKAIRTGVSKPCPQTSARYRESRPKAATSRHSSRTAPCGAGAAMPRSSAIFLQSSVSFFRLPQAAITQSFYCPLAKSDAGAGTTTLSPPCQRTWELLEKSQHRCTGRWHSSRTDESRRGASSMHHPKRVVRWSTSPAVATTLSRLVRVTATQMGFQTRSRSQRRGHSTRMATGYSMPVTAVRLHRSCST